MITITYILFLTCISLAASADSSSSHRSGKEKQNYLQEAETQSLLDEAEKVYILTEVYAKKWNDIMPNVSNEEEDSHITQNEIGNISKNQLLAALHEIYQSIQLNLTSWHCSFFRKMCPRHTDEETAEKCAQFGKFMSWYNGKLKAREFVDAFNKVRKQTKEIEGMSFEYNVEELANKIDTILDYLKIINKIFSEANLTYDDIFKELKKAGANLNDNETELFNEPGEFLLESRYRFIKHVENEFMYVTNYVQLFFNPSAPTISDFREMTPDYEILKKIWKNIKNMENLETRYSKVPEVFSLEKKNINTKLDHWRISVSKPIGQRNWKIVEMKDGSIDYEIKLF